MNKHKQWIKQLENSSHIGILVVDKERNNLYVNSRLCEMFAYEKEFLLQKTAEVFHVNNETFLKFAELVFDAVLTGTPLEIDYEFKRQDGSLFWAHISGDPVECNEEVLWTLVDVTKNVIAQKEALHQYTMLDSVINTTPDLIFYKDYLHKDGEYIGCNNAFSSFVGESKEHIIGRTDIELFGEEVGAFFRKKDKEMLAQGETVINEEWVDYPNGDRVLLSTSKTPFQNSDNERVGILGVSRDITAMHNSNQHIKTLSERNELALLGNNDGIWDWNLLNNEVYYSPRWKGMLGYTDEELVNEFATWENLVHPEDKTMVLKAVQENIDGKSEYVDVFHRLKHKDGHWVWIHDRSKAIHDEDGKAIRMIGTHTDVSDEKARELKYAQLAQMIEQTHDSVISTDLDGVIES
ncbi:MAG: PAS domain S-box protein, partial [Helicobacteraceae bacterium]|nr:PAS domain S-box protein [Candidatus Sulfurimonas ponti]